jgi:hypothetical protein
MNMRGKLMVGGAIVLVIGIIIMLFGYNKYKSVEGALTMLANGSPPGTVETTVGILIVVIGAFIAIHGFGLLPEDTKVQ